MRSPQLRPQSLTFSQKLWNMNWSFLILLTLTASVGFVMLYSAAGGNLEPWAIRQMVRFGLGMTLLLAVALTDVRIWLRFAYVIYAIALVMVIAVEVTGSIGMGAQRWIDLGFIRLQPSEVMKVAMIMALARHFHSGDLEDSRRLRFYLLPLVIIAAPVVLVLRQPDLGTAVMLLLVAAALIFLAGASLRLFLGTGLLALLAVPAVWIFYMRDYQKNRVLTFLNPERDPLGAGYHITQSKIALGSGGLSGRGFLQGSQSHLNFLPEKHTDFIFTMLAEELGMIGSLGLIGLYILILVFGFVVALRARHHFGRLLALGVTLMFFIYVFINIAMVTGLMPVVGVPLPLVSYGGTAMLTLMFGFGLVMSVSIHRHVVIGRHGASEE